ncbi:MAG TPA: 16S rRNA (adenine(1518)-N(6)/adenine(1519)-N(6))-dimethyltransferase RsmA [Ignavibacteria bacterium]|nr:16S rRNA (adenine(1518)-N(6)/adenine(1519)-N(6))-dimethyltransferase RsmA [Ignavibacteria bacterium]
MKSNNIYNTRPKKSLGQNYLIDENICRNIVDTFEIEQGEHIIEIGPGRGALTKYILQKTSNLTVIELDRNNCTFLKDLFPGLNIVNADFLKLDLDKLRGNPVEKLRVIGNIPYNITSPIIFKLMDFRTIVKDAQLMIQEEVARRITADPDNKEYGIPSVLLNVFGSSKLLFKVSRNCFYPKPKVDSRIIYFDFSVSLEEDVKDKVFFRKLVKAAFGTRRKTLKNALKNIDADLSKAEIDLGRRAENLTIHEFIELSNRLC